MEGDQLGISLKEKFDQVLEYVGEKLANGDDHEQGELNEQIQQINKCIQDLWEIANPQERNKSAGQKRKLTVYDFLPRHSVNMGIGERATVACMEVSGVNVGPTIKGEYEENDSDEDSDVFLNISPEHSFDPARIGYEEEKVVPEMEPCVPANLIKREITEKNEGRRKYTQKNYLRLSHGYKLENEKLGIFYCRCGNKYGSIKSLMSHVNYYNKEKRFCCTLCDCRYPYQSLLNKHLKVFHKIEMGERVETRSAEKAERQKRCGDWVENTKRGKKY